MNRHPNLPGLQKLSVKKGIIFRWHLILDGLKAIHRDIITRKITCEVVQRYLHFSAYNVFK